MALEHIATDKDTVLPCPTSTTPAIAACYDAFSRCCGWDELLEACTAQKQPLIRHQLQLLSKRGSLCSAPISPTQLATHHSAAQHAVLCCVDATSPGGVRAVLTAVPGPRIFKCGLAEAATASETGVLRRLPAGLLDPHALVAVLDGSQSHTNIATAMLALTTRVSIALIGASSVAGAGSVAALDAVFAVAFSAAQAMVATARNGGGVHHSGGLLAAALRGLAHGSGNPAHARCICEATLATWLQSVCNRTDPGAPADASLRLSDALSRAVQFVCMNQPSGVALRALHQSGIAGSMAIPLSLSACAEAQARLMACMA